MRVVFMGTPDFAAESLAALSRAGFEIAGVFTQPDRPKGRGMKLAACETKKLALELGYPVYQPESLKTGEAAELLRSLAPELLCVVAYGKLLPDEILAIPKYGAVNVHGSLLPRYRGASPIQWSVLNGDEYAGVTTMYLAHDMDAGDIIYQSAVPVGEYETAGELFDRLAGLGGELLVKTVSAIEAGAAPRRPQNHAEATYVGQLDKSLCPIDWTGSPREIIKHVCGLNPWPVATMELAGETLKVFAARYTDTVTDKAPGRVVSAGKDGLEIACGGGKTVLITELQAPGRKRMSAAAYLVGHPVSVE
ncbi:MAG TPA: methionyl-tRNA formyltransferase [Candidatus Scatomorpha merdipullorum]|uniref:Methionyl-tRNA formyltransferase n=1 Tax=Candidatus Scatomorpha merdipullorum TaxID=2840927 RepID=A0A9D1JVD4_9FIRM|nr:methionyl-tRNA formyltransferase [Candidatus Scatomorpha merdipullorum]